MRHCIGGVPLFSAHKSKLRLSHLLRLDHGDLLPPQTCSTRCMRHGLRLCYRVLSWSHRAVRWPVLVHAARLPECAPWPPQHHRRCSTYGSSWVMRTAPLPVRVDMFLKSSSAEATSMMSTSESRTCIVDTGATAPTACRDFVHPCLLSV